MTLDKTKEERKEVLDKTLGDIFKQYGKIFCDIGVIESFPYTPNIHVLSK